MALKEQPGEKSRLPHNQDPSASGCYSKIGDFKKLQIIYSFERPGDVPVQRERLACLSTASLTKYLQMPAMVRAESGGDQEAGNSSKMLASASSGSEP